MAPEDLRTNAGEMEVNLIGVSGQFLIVSMAIVNPTTSIEHIFIWNWQSGRLISVRQFIA